MLHIVFITVMTINAFFNEQSTINVVALKQEVNTEYYVKKDRVFQWGGGGGLCILRLVFLSFDLRETKTKM